jgi:hypothetical protein
MLEFLGFRQFLTLGRLLVLILTKEMAIIEGDNYGQENGTSGNNRDGCRQPIGLQRDRVLAVLVGRSTWGEIAGGKYFFRDAH